MEASFPWTRDQDGHLLYPFFAAIPHIVDTSSNNSCVMERDLYSSFSGIYGCQTITSSHIYIAGEFNLVIHNSTKGDFVTRETSQQGQRSVEFVVSLNSLRP